MLRANSSMEKINEGRVLTKKWTVRSLSAFHSKF